MIVFGGVHTVVVATRAQSSSTSIPATLAGGVAVYHSPGAGGFFGIGYLHAFDIGKYDRIAADLVASGLVPANGFGVAPAVTDDDLAQVHDPLVAELIRPNPPFTCHRSVCAWRVSTLCERTGLGTVSQSDRCDRGRHTPCVEERCGHQYRWWISPRVPRWVMGFVSTEMWRWPFTPRAKGLFWNGVDCGHRCPSRGWQPRLFADDPSVISFSMHGKALFPHPKLVGDRDVGLPGGVEDDEFLAILETELDALMAQHQPKLVIHVAGADILHDDPLANLQLTPEGLVHRDRLVARKTRELGAAFVHTLAGGYGPSAANAQSESIQAMLRDFGDGT